MLCYFKRILTQTRWSVKLLIDQKLIDTETNVLSNPYLVTNVLSILNPILFCSLIYREPVCLLDKKNHISCHIRFKSLHSWHKNFNIHILQSWCKQPFDYDIIKRKSILLLKLAQFQGKEQLRWRKITWRII